MYRIKLSLGSLSHVKSYNHMGFTSSSFFDERAHFVHAAVHEVALLFRRLGGHLGGKRDQGGRQPSTSTRFTEVAIEVNNVQVRVAALRLAQSVGWVDQGGCVHHGRGEPLGLTPGVGSGQG